jgi:methyltransferase
MLIAEQFFLGVIVYTILQRISEVLMAKRNTKKLLERGAVEFGASHYSMMVLLHAGFFVSLIVEFLVAPGQSFHPSLLILFAGAQAIRFWIMRVLGDRWTTRVLVVRAEKLVARGPYRYFAHPNYLVVAVEILVLPLAFKLWITAVIFTMLNAAMLLMVRIPIEQRALSWSQGRVAGTSLNPN